jgi:hypothetical protein
MFANITGIVGAIAGFATGVLVERHHEKILMWLYGG